MKRPGWPSKSGYPDFSQLFLLAEWGTEAACGDAPDKEAFFEQDQHAEVAQTFCAVCPVQLDCLQHALRVNEWGTWGGAWVPPAITQKIRTKMWKEALRERTQAA